MRFGGLRQISKTELIRFLDAEMNRFVERLSEIPIQICESNPGILDRERVTLMGSEKFSGSESEGTKTKTILYAAFVFFFCDVSRR